MQHESLPLGIWRSVYTYPSSGRKGSFEGRHYVKLHRQDDGHAVFESVSDPNVNKSYLLIRLSLDNDIATGSWQEQTEPEGYYKGAVYHGAIQLIMNAESRELSGKWVGFGKDMEVNVGPWVLTYIGEQLPEGAGALNAVGA